MNSQCDPAALHIDASTIQPFLKWAGGKRWLFRRHRDLFPHHFKRLIDPFLGGGASFFSLLPTGAVLSDVNSDLIDLYKTVRSRPRALTRQLRTYHDQHSPEFYYAVRAHRPHKKLDRAAWLLYLNRTCWNGLFRVNLRGQFNVPIGTKTRVFFGDQELDVASALLRQSELRCDDFESAIRDAGPGDLVFADPPYFSRTKRGDIFVKYNPNVFSWSDQVRLKAALEAAKGRGAVCFVTNANQECLVELYRDCGRIHTLRRHSVLASSSERRTVRTEILVELR